MTPLDVARSQVGVAEERGNRGIPYKRYALTGEDPLPWCSRFVRWCFIQAGEALPGNRYLIARVQTLLEELQAAGAMLAPGEHPQPGDIMFLSERGKSDKGPGSHIALVDSADALTVNSIDGNYGDAVCEVSRKRSDPTIIGYARWPKRPV